MSHQEVTVITGVTSGIGRATARRFASAGHAVGLVSRGGPGLDNAADEIRRIGGLVHPVACDIADADGLEQAAAQIEAALGPVDNWVNNAMATVYSPHWRITPEEYRRVTEVSYLGAVYGTLCALSRMRRRGRGRVIQVGSALAYRGIPLQSAYCGAKHAMRGFTDSVRSELIHENSAIRISMVHLGAFNTPQFERGRSHLPREPRPLSPIFQPELAAEAILQATRSYRREWYVGASTLKTIWGQKLVPALMDHLAARRGWSGQMRDEPTAPDRPDNLFEPVPRDFGAHGPFDGPAQEDSLQYRASRNRGRLAGSVVLLAGALFAARRWFWRRR